MTQPASPDACADPAAIIQKLEGDLASIRRDLEHGERLATIGTIAAGVAHEINNILTPALAYCQLAKTHPSDHPLQVRAIEKSLVCIDLATRIARQILEFGACRDEPAVAGVDQCLKAAIECLARDPAKDRVELSVDIQAGGFVSIRPLALQQVLLNLVLNACNAMHGKGGRLRIQSIDRADGTTCISVSDTGPGISPEIANRLFEPFVTTRGHHQKNQKRGGYGLGLAVCQRLIEDAGGTIASSSRPNCGTTFTIVLPTARSKRAKAV